MGNSLLRASYLTNASTGLGQISKAAWGFRQSIAASTGVVIHFHGTTIIASLSMTWRGFRATNCSRSSQDRFRSGTRIQIGTKCHLANVGFHVREFSSYL